MTISRAIEILNPEHREDYESIDVVNEACRMGMNALEKEVPKKPIHSEEQDIRYITKYECPNCGKCFTGFRIAECCYHCGQKLDWSEDDGKN